MDKFIQSYDPVLDKGAEPKDDLMLCYTQGVAYQRDMSYHVDFPYFDVYESYSSEKEKLITAKLNTAREAFVRRHVGNSLVLDVGVGNGEFICSRPYTAGYDVDPKAAYWLKEQGYWREDFETFRAFTFWDVIEHLKEPQRYFSRILDQSKLFACVPIFDNLNRIRFSKHFRPGEHLYYWTLPGFVDWMAKHGFSMLGDPELFEVEAGREGVVSFAFVKELKVFV